MISVIIPSYLKDYPGGATNRPDKFRRALTQLQLQTYQDWECIIVSDGCNLTVDIYREFNADSRFRCFQIEKQKPWSGNARNVGIEKARGSIITYCDTDDYYGINHLQNINDNFDLNKYDWCFFNDLVLSDNGFINRPCSPSIGRCGTSNIAHKKLDVFWDVRNDYGRDDWNFIQKLKKFRMQIITGGEYCVCHLPKKIDV